MSKKKKARVDGDAASAAPRDELATLAEVRRGGGTFHEVIFTTNRRTMASVTNRGATLRLHEQFAVAPARVLHALARLFTAKQESARGEARRVVQAFLAEHNPHENTEPPRSFPREVLLRDEPHLARLRAEFDRVNKAHFGTLLPPVPLFLSGRMTTRNGHFSRKPLEIVISRRLCVRAAPGEAEHTLRHEMIHLWQHVVGTRPDHGGAFRWWARLLDVRPRARRPVRMINDE